MVFDRILQTNRRVMIIRLLICCIFLTCLNFFGQEVLILDEENNPISNVAVFNSEKTKSILSNYEGFVNLSRFKKREILIMQHPNFVEKKIAKKLISSTIQLIRNNKVLKVVELKENKNSNNIKNVAETSILDISTFESPPFELPPSFEFPP